MGVVAGSKSRRAKVFKTEILAIAVKNVLQNGEEDFAVVTKRRRVEQKVAKKPREVLRTVVVGLLGGEMEVADYSVAGG